MKRFIGFVLLVTSLATATAGDFELGRAAYERGDYAAALAHWLPLAEQGVVEAQYRVGRLYYYGNGVETNLAEAGRWYTRAAKQGHARSQSNLAIMYEKGEGLPRDDGRAAEWYAKAAEQGRAVSQNNLGRLYETGRGVPQDYARAAELYDRAARQGYPEAQHNLGRMYRDGRGVPQDDRKAEKWMSRASRGGYVAPAAAAAGAATAVEAAPDPSDSAPSPPATEDPSVSAAAAASPEPAPVGGAAIPETEEIVGDFAAGVTAYDEGDYAGAAREWLPLAEDGNREAQHRLARLYHQGLGVTRNDGEAGRWYRAAADQGHDMAMYYLAFIYMRGPGLSDGKDQVWAYVWFSLAAERGVGDASTWLDTLTKRMSKKAIAEARGLIDEQKVRLEGSR